MTVADACRTGWCQAIEWLNIILFMGGLRDKFLNHDKRAVAQLPADQRTWEDIKETAAVQQDHESNRRKRANSFNKRGSVNYRGQRGTQLPEYCYIKRKMVLFWAQSHILVQQLAQIAQLCKNSFLCIGQIGLIGVYSVHDFTRQFKLPRKDTSI